MTKKMTMMIMIMMMLIVLQVMMVTMMMMMMVMMVMMVLAPVQFAIQYCKHSQPGLFRLFWLLVPSSREVDWPLRRQYMRLLSQLPVSLLRSPTRISLKVGLQQWILGGKDSKICFRFIFLSIREGLLVGRNASDGSELDCQYLNPHLTSGQWPSLCTTFTIL